MLSFAIFVRRAVACLLLTGAGCVPVLHGPAFLAGGSCGAVEMVHDVAALGASGANDAFADLKELTEAVVVAETLARNPSLAQMAAMADMAAARYPQVTALDDPMAAGFLGPASIGSREVDTAYRLEVSQKFPFPGKRFWRGQNALADAAAARSDVDAMRLELAELARNAFIELRLVGRLLKINAESAGLLKDFKDNAQTRYQTGQASQQDVLQADVELARQRERLLELEQMAKVAAARINALVHRAPDAPLPPTAGALEKLAPLPDAAELRRQARERRPELRALSERIQAEEAGLMVALKERCPDFELMAAYDAFWQRPEQDLRTMIGVRVNLPVVASRRQGMVQEAQAKIAQRRAELAKLTQQINFQVHEAHAQAERAAKTVKLYEESILPAAQANIKAAQSAYVTGKIPFLSLIEAQRNLIMLRERYDEMVAAQHRARAALDRAAGLRE
jgi:cobalt-zinc-cadmium efflux system outer membrane protein